ncbi:MAG: hypothetical protein ACRC50_08030 [Gaiella sp.]
MGEYALLTSAIALVVVGALSGVARTLPATTSASTETVVLVARGAGVSPAEARRALQTSPYTRPSLRTLWGIGWVAGKRDPVTCAFARVGADVTRRAAVGALGTIESLPRTLRQAKVGRAAATTAVERGFRAACG